MDLTRERALELHRQMWSEMKEELGDNPSKLDRTDFKEDWCLINFPDTGIISNCFLCEYVRNTYGRLKCEHCPINWGPVKNVKFRCMGYTGNVDYGYSPISEILALPEEPEEE